MRWRWVTKPISKTTAQRNGIKAPRHKKKVETWESEFM